MSAAFGASVKVTGSATTSLTTGSITTQASGSTFVALTNDLASPGATPVSDNKGNSYGAAFASQLDSVTTLRAYKKENGAGGSGHTATFTFAASADPTCIFGELTSVAASSYDSGSLSQGTDTSTPFTNTSGALAQADSIVLSFIGTQGNASGGYTESTGFTIAQQETDSSLFWTAALGYKVVSSTSAVTPSWTISGGATDAALITVAFKGAPPPGPSITLQPAPINVIVGQNATFTIDATPSGGSNSYQWKFNGSNVGTNSPTYTRTTTSADNRGVVRCDVTDSNGTTVSANATLTLSWHDVYLYSMPEDADPDDVRLRDPTQVAAGGTHTTTGALAAQDAAIAGTAVHSVLHATTGALSAQAATIAGTAAHLTLHTSTGALSAQAAAVSGAAAHQHAATGALSAQAATIAGTAVHNLLHTSTGALTAQDATIAGTAADEHSSTGALSAQAAAIAGTATHLTLHTSTGALTAQDATISGAALHPHTSTGALSAQAATISGAALHPHTSTGALAAQASTISGTALHPHTSTGALAADAATISGSADHTTTGTSHSTTGALTAQDATVAGTATHLTLHTSTGALAAQASTISGVAAHQHAATGALAADAATISGAAAHEHATTGALAAQAATVDGTAVHSAAGTHDATGALTAQDATMSGVAEHIGTGESVLSPKFLGSPNVVIRKVKAEEKPADAEPLPAQITNVPDAPPPVKLSPSIMDLLGFAPPVTPLPIETPEIPEFKVTVKPRKEPPAPDPAPEVAPPPPPAPPPAPVDPVKAVEVRLDALNSQLETALSEVAALRAKLEAQASAQVQVKTAVERVAVDTAAIARREQNRQRAEEITRRLLKDLAEED